MSTDPHNLRNLLAEVHQKLTAASSVDPQSRELLVTVMQDIEAQLTRDGAQRGRAPGLEQLAVRFEAEHPAIAQLLRHIGQLLAQAGI